MGAKGCVVFVAGMQVQGLVVGPVLFLGMKLISVDYFCGFKGCWRISEGFMMNVQIVQLKFKFGWYH